MNDINRFAVACERGRRSRGNRSRSVPFADFRRTVVDAVAERAACRRPVRRRLRPVRTSVDVYAVLADSAARPCCVSARRRSTRTAFPR